MASYYGRGGEERGRDYQQNWNGPRDRSRSREYNNSRGGGGWGGGRGQSIERRGTDIMVRTNYIP